jgi:hypothetical protein
MIEKPASGVGAGAPRLQKESFESGATYQDVELWIHELRTAGWRPWNIRTGKESRGSTTWRAPSGLFYRGPYRAWTVMKTREIL